MKNLQLYKNAERKSRTATEGNILLGIIGALLFSFIGVALWFLVYQIGFIAGICGFVMIAVVFKGYEIFGSKLNYTGSIICFVISIIMIFVSEVFCLGFHIYNAYRAENHLTFFGAYRQIPAFLSGTYFSNILKTDLIIGYALAIVVLLIQIAKIKRRSSKNIKSAEEKAQTVN